MLHELEQQISTQMENERLSQRLAEQANEIASLRKQLIDSDAALIKSRANYAKCKKDAERYRFDSYAGVIMWIGDKRTMKIATREQVASEVEYGCVIVHTAQQFLDELSALGETNAET